MTIEFKSDRGPLNDSELLETVTGLANAQGGVLLVGVDAQANALGLVSGTDLIPTMAGLLLVGKEESLYTHIPTHEVAFQVLRGTDVLVNEFYRWPLLRASGRVGEWVPGMISGRVSP